MKKIELEEGPVPAGWTRKTTPTGQRVTLPFVEWVAFERQWPAPSARLTVRVRHDQSGRWGYWIGWGECNALDWRFDCFRSAADACAAAERWIEDNATAIPVAAILTTSAVVYGDEGEGAFAERREWKIDALATLDGHRIRVDVGPLGAVDDDVGRYSAVVPADLGPLTVREVELLAWSVVSRLSADNLDEVGERIRTGG